MAISAGSKVIASDGSAVQTQVATAYKTTTGSTKSWTNSIAAGTILKYAALEEIKNTIVSANSSYKPSVSCAHYGTYAKCPSNKSHNSNNSNNWADSGFSNN